VSGIGSVGTGTFPNPVYPDAGIALSTGTTWASSIPNNSTNWNTAFTDRLKWDGGSTGLVAATGRTSLGGTTIGQSMFTLTNPSAITFPRFNADNTVTARTAANFRSDIGAGTVTSVNIASGTPISITNNTTIPEISMAAATGSVNGYLTSTDWTTFNNKQNALGFTPANSTITINTTSPLQGGGNLTANRTFSILSASDSQSGIVTTTSQLFGGSKVFKNRVTVDSVLTLNTTTAIPNQILGINTVGNVNSVGKLSLGAGLSITSSTLLADTNLLITRYDTASMLTNYLQSGTAASTYQTKLNGTGFVKASGTTISYDNSTYLTTGTAASTYQTILTNPVTGTGTNDFIAKFTSTGSTIGNSTLIDNGTTISTSSILSTTNYASLDAGNNTHRLTNTLSGNQTWTPSSGFITSYDGQYTSGGWYYSGSNSGFPILSILSTSNDRKKSGITLNSEGTANGTYSPAITFSSLSNSTAYYSAYAAIIGKKTGTGGYNGTDLNWNSGHIEFYGTAQVSEALGGVMLTPPNMVVGVGVGIGYDAPPTIKGRLIVSEKIGINQSTPTFALDVSGTANITGATTLGSTLAVTGATTINNVLTINSGASNGLLLNGTNDQNIKIYSSNTNGNAGIFYQNATTGQTQGVDGLFIGVIGQLGSYFINSENTKSYLHTNSNSNQLVLDTDGNVGIGIEDATNKLDVNGTLRVRTTNTVASTALLGKDNNGVVGGVIIGSGLTLSNSTLSLSASSGGFITTNNNYTVTITDTWIVFNNNFDNIIVTLPDASTSLGRTLYFRNVAAGSIVSAGTANIIDNTITTGTPNNNILGAGNTNVKWCTLVSNGQYWIKMQAGSL